MPSKPRNHGTMTEAAFRSFIMSMLRSKSRFWKPRNAALEAACVGRKENPATGKLKKHYECATCKRHIMVEEVDLDHIDPVIPLDGFDSWDGVVSRLYPEVDGWRVLCKPCHKQLTQEQNKQRKERRT